jgi:ubiquinone/menaquinone biosynthesis C-methylase UbiE
MNRQAFFDEIAERWDEICKSEQVLRPLNATLARFNIGVDERVVDLGCGTGVLTGCLLEHLGEKGRVEAVDFSTNMIRLAEKKHPDGRVRFHCCDATRLPLDDGCIDRVLCFSTWPHFPDPDAVTREAKRILKPGGYFHIWHVESREKINSIHREAGPPIENDLLEEINTLAGRLINAGFTITEQIDDADSYLASAERSAP